jgi:gliding motility-associated-like protein
VHDSSECYAIDQLEVKVPESEIYFPNVIAANSTNNEVFTVYGASKVEIIKLMTVVDRYGHLIFRKEDLYPNDTQAGWNGRSDGKRVMPGVYMYECLLQLQDGTKQIHRGNITVLN